MIQSNLALKLLESRLTSFRMNKFFCLLQASLAVGNSLQKTLVQLPNNFSSLSMQEDILTVHYKLRLGKSYVESFPKAWFSQDSLLALNASCHSGDINRALKAAAKEHDEKWQRQLALLEKAFPIITLFVAGIFVSQTLINIYTPLLDLS